MKMNKSMFKKSNKPIEVIENKMYYPEQMSKYLNSQESGPKSLDREKHAQPHLLVG
jgi:hypothetical protein